MSKPTSQTPTTKREPPTQEQLKKMATIPCNKGDNCEYYKRGNCRYLHGGGAVAFDQRSHQRVPPAQPAPPPPTQDQILAKIGKLKGFGQISIYMFDSVIDDKLAVLRVLMKANVQLRDVKDPVKQSMADNKDISSKLVELMISLEPFLNSESKVGRAFSNMRDRLTKGMTSCQIEELVDDFIPRFALPKEIEEIIPAFDSQTASYAHAVNLSPLDRARRNPDVKPDAKLIEFLQNIPHFSESIVFKEILSLYSGLGKSSPFMNKEFVGAYDAFMKLREGMALMEEQRATQRVKEQHKKTVQQIVREIDGLKATSLGVSFRIMTTHRDIFSFFVETLDETNRSILTTHFLSFMSVYSAYMSISLDGTITHDSLNKAFLKFLDSFKLNEESRTLDKEFFEFSRNSIFPFFWELFNTKCPCPEDGGKTRIVSSDIFKRFVKAIDGIFGGSVDVSERKLFEEKLFERGLVILLMVMMSPDGFSRLVSAAYSKTYAVMKTCEYQSFLYSLAQIATNERRRRHSSVPDGFEWSSLPNLFTETENGSQYFSVESLFDAIDATISSFMTATNNGLNRIDVNQFIHDKNLDWLFGCREKFDGDFFMYVKDNNQLPPEVIRFITDCNLVNEASEGARQGSHLKSLLSLPPKEIRPMMKLFISITSSNDPEEAFNPLCSLLGLKIESDPKKEIAFNGLKYFLTILLESSQESNVYAEALLMMPAFSYIQKMTGFSKFFMSLPETMIFVLMRIKFPDLTYCEIANVIYKVHHGHNGVRGTVVMTPNVISRMMDGLHDSSTIKVILEKFAVTRAKESLETAEKNCKACEEIVRRFEMLFEKHCKVLSEFLKRGLSYFTNALYMAELFKDSGEQVNEVSASEQSPEDALNNRLKASFMMCLNQSILHMRKKIISDLSKTIKDIKQDSSFAINRLKFYMFATQISASINLVNSLSKNMGMQFRISFEQIMNGLPDTKGQDMTPLQKATLMIHHVCGILNISVQENVDDFDQDVPESVFFYVISKSFITIYNTELPKKKIERGDCQDSRKTPIVSLKTIMEESTTLDEVFLNGLPYMDSPLIRAFLIQILKHHFLSGNKGKLDSLLRRLLTFELKFTHIEKDSFVDVFSYITAPLPDIQRLKSYVLLDEELFVQIKDSLGNDDAWTDANVSVIISESNVKNVQPRFKFVKAPVDSSMPSSEAGAIVEVKSEEVDDSPEEFVEASSVSQPFDATYLRELLLSNQPFPAIAYLQSVELGEYKGILQAAIEMLGDTENPCSLVLEGLVQNGILRAEED